MSTRPTSITRSSPYSLTLSWSDGVTSTIRLSDLRDACPCAHCAGESIMGQQVFIGMKTFKEGMNELSALQQVGNYGLQATWKDGHDTGIYTWELLRSLCDTKAMTPREIEQLSAQS